MGERCSPYYNKIWPTIKVGTTFNFFRPTIKVGPTEQVGTTETRHAGVSEYFCFT
jgi:hypothetical protein